MTRVVTGLKRIILTRKINFESKKNGHRQSFTEIAIKGIKVKKQAAKKEAAEK